MENNELFQTIERLKESLSDVESARHQVSETVSAYKGTQVEINSFVSKLQQIEHSLSGLIALLQNNKVLIEQQASQSVEVLCASCEEVITQTKSSLSSSSTAFTEQNKKAVDELNAQITRLHETIDKTSALSNEVQKTSNAVASLIASVGTLQTELASSQQAQDKAISEIDTSQKDMSNQLSATDSTINNIVTSLNGQDNSLAQLSQSLSAANSKLKGLDTLLKGVQQALINHTSILNNQIVQNLSSLNDTIKEGQSTLQSKVGVLQILLIIQLVISVITLIVFFALK